MSAFPARRPVAWVALALATFTLNASWEIAQMPLYDVDFRIARCLRAAAGDVALIVAAVAAATTAQRIRPVIFWPLLIGALVLIAVAVEREALAMGRWSYAEAMPTLGGIGLTPLVQLPLLGALGVLIARRTATAARTDRRR